MDATKKAEESDAGSVTPSARRWRVTFAHDHETLARGQIVVVCETPNKATNVLFRLSDCTLHTLTDHHDQYVHLRAIGRKA